MDKKDVWMRLLFLVLISVIFSSFSVSSSNHTVQTGVPEEVSQNVPDKAYACLESKVNNQTKFSLEQAIFATLALGSKKSLIDSIKENKNPSDACWPAGGCKLKESAQVALAYQRAGERTEEITNWISSKEAIATGLIWHLEIDILDHTAAECTIRYDEVKSNVNILNDMKIGSGAATGCYAPSASGYWLEISDRCIDKKFEISCNKDFVTTLLYEKKSGDTIFVSSETHNAAQGALTSEQVQAKCFKTGGECDYEGSLWAVMALHKIGKSIEKYTPYLQALAEDNKKYFSSAFLYYAQPTQEQFKGIIQEQKQAKFWELIGTPYKKYYDTGLAMLALDRSSSQRNEISQAKQYLSSTQLKDGCWNARDSIIDTAFILYAGWPRAVSISGGGGGGGGETTFCSSVSGASCEADKNACLGAGGRELTAYTCLKSREFCCSVKVPEKGCKDANGNMCSSNQECLAEIIDSSDSGICCSEACAGRKEPNTCPSSASCKSSCGGDEEEVQGASCGDEKICCSEKADKGGGSNYMLILILGILILLVIIGIIYRNKLQLAWFKWRGKVKITPVTKEGPGSAGMPIRTFGARPPFMPSIRRPVARAPLRHSLMRDKELEDTMKKLKEMTK